MAHQICGQLNKVKNFCEIELCGITKRVEYDAWLPQNIVNQMIKKLFYYILVDVYELKKVEK